MATPDPRQQQQHFWRMAGLALVVAGLGPLALALTSQYVFGLRPCSLCIWQRVPYAVVALLGLGALVHVQWRGGTRDWPLPLALFWLAGLAFLVGAGLAGYHAAVEYGWVSGPGGCTSSAAPGASIEELRALIANTAIVRCDDAPGYWLGLSMAGWNVLANLGLLAALVLLVRCRPRVMR